MLASAAVAAARVPCGSRPIGKGVPAVGAAVVRADGPLIEAAVGHRQRAETTPCPGPARKRRGRMGLGAVGGGGHVLPPSAPLREKE